VTFNFYICGRACEVWESVCGVAWRECVVWESVCGVAGVVKIHGGGPRRGTPY
jgi:hypothetical protein